MTLRERRPWLADLLVVALVMGLIVAALGAAFWYGQAKVEPYRTHPSTTQPR